MKTNVKFKTLLSNPWSFTVLNVVDMVATIIALNMEMYEGNGLYYVLGPTWFFIIKMVLSAVITILGLVGIIKAKYMLLLNIGIGIVAIWTLGILLIGAAIYLTILL